MNVSRMGQRRKRQKNAKPATLNLVSLMDIFTILVFFLMVNSSDVEVLEMEANIKLPDSNAQQRPEERLLISVNADNLIVQGKTVASVDELLANKAETIPELRAALLDYLNTQSISLKGAASQNASLEGNAVTIMGDRELPYQLLKRIMLTCQNAEFTRIALAVNRTTTEQAALWPQPTIEDTAQQLAPQTGQVAIGLADIGGRVDERHG